MTIYTLSLHDALPILHFQNFFDGIKAGAKLNSDIESGHISTLLCQLGNISQRVGSSLETDPKKDRKSTRLNSSHVAISYAVFCLKKKTSIFYRIKWRS